MLILRKIFVWLFVCGVALSSQAGNNNSNESSSRGQKVLQKVPLFLNDLNDAYIRVLFDAVFKENVGLVKETLQALFEGIQNESMRCEYITSIDFHGWTLLHYAAQNGNLEIIELLLAIYPEGEGSLCEFITIRGDANQTAIDVAQENGDDAVVELLLGYYEEEQEEDPQIVPINPDYMDITDLNQNNPLHGSGYLNF